MSRGKRKDQPKLGRAISFCFLDPAQAEEAYREDLRPQSSLQGALDAPRRRNYYENERDIVALAGSLLWAVTRTHALIDGNKRASIMLCDDFLQINNFHLEGNEQELSSLVWAAAAESIQEADLVESLRDYIYPGKTVESFAARYPNVISALAL